jgi:multidrug efflux system outer membrane protein
MIAHRMTCRVVVRGLLVGALACAAAATLSSCTVGPNYQRPGFEVPGAFASASTQPTSQPTTQPAALGRDWWKLFGDPTLTRLEEDAVKANTDLQAAIARVAQARAANRVALSQFYPVVTLDPSIQRARTPLISRSNSNGVSIGTTGGTTSSRSSASGGRTATNVRIPFDVSYEVDVWGRVRRAVESAQAQVRATEDDYQVVLQTLQADVAQNYFTLRSLDSQAQILEQNVQAYRQQITLTQTQRNAGLVGPIDVAQAQTLLNSTQAQQIDIRRQRADTQHALAILLGRPPSEITVLNQPLDLAPPLVPAGLPADLLRRRPDVTAAEQNLIAANAQIGIATAAFYPTFRLTGSAGFESIDLQHALDWENRVWSIGPSVSFPLFTGGQLTAQLEQARARYEELNANYRGSILAAFRDVEDSLTDLHLRADEAQAQDQAVQYAREYLRLSQIQYKGGLTNYLQVIDAERTLLTNELSAVQILNQRLVSTVLLIKSLGGGWDVSMPPP